MVAMVNIITHRHKLFIWLFSRRGFCALVIVVCSCSKTVVDPIACRVLALPLFVMQH